MLVDVATDEAAADKALAVPVVVVGESCFRRGTCQKDFPLAYYDIAAVVAAWASHSSKI